jgi:sugar phosphate isomerase/epimerase
MPKDFDGTIAKVTATGYKEVEFAGYFKHSPKEVRAAIDKNGLAAPSQHIAYDIVEKQWPETLEASHVVGHKYIVCPWIDEKQRTAEGWKRARSLIMGVSQKAESTSAITITRLNLYPSKVWVGNLLAIIVGGNDAKLVKMETGFVLDQRRRKDPVSTSRNIRGDSAGAREGLCERPQRDEQLCRCDRFCRV